MKHILAFLFFSGGLLTGMAQMKNTIRGRVVQGEKGEPVPGASVFITNTSKGTVSDSSGSFELANVPYGTYDLIVSSIGFETQSYTYKAEQLPLRLEIKLHPKVEELETVVVEPDEKNGWQRWGKLFTDDFLGMNKAGRDCRIKNYTTLRFRYSRKRKLLRVLADEPLDIENKALGYRIKYQLENFYLDFTSYKLVFYGYTLFSELDSRKGPTRRQLKNREEAYNGSLVHFMKSLYHDSLAAEGFEVRRLVRRRNDEKERVKPIYRQQRAGTMDSTAYYERIMHQPDIIDDFGKTVLTADSLLTRTGVSTKSLFFTDYLFVEYKREEEDPDYLLYTHAGRRPYSSQRSNAFLPDALSITIEPTGNYYPPQSFMTLGYWAWNEKIGTLLPLDYKK